MARARVVFLTLAVLLFAGAVCHAQAPVFEHNQEVDKKSLDCEVCQAVVHQISKKLDAKTVGKKGRELQVFKAMEKICDVESFRLYEFAPPSMIKACNTLIGQHEETLEKLFKTSNDEKQIREQLCVKKTKRCAALWTDAQERKIRGEKNEEDIAREKEAAAKAEEARKARDAEKKEKKKKAAAPAEPAPPAAEAPKTEL